MMMINKSYLTEMKIFLLSFEHSGIMNKTEQGKDEQADREYNR